jgi:hypothetical protein
MPSFAIVVVVDASLPEEAWESVEERLLGDAGVDIAHISAPWKVPAEASANESVEYDIDSISLKFNGKSAILKPAA